MPDKDSVINSLNEIMHYNGKQMFYNDIFIRGIADEAITLLKERDEPIRPTLNESHSYVSDAFKCGKCGHIIRFHAKYCENCGQGVEWNA